MSPVLEAPRARICADCGNYTFKRGNSNGATWAYCEAKKKWFPDNIEKLGERKACEDWQ